MWSKISNKLFLAVIVSFLLISCSNGNDDSTNAPSREIKYEITGTYSGHLDVFYSNEFGDPVSLVVTSLPWSKTITYPSDITVIGITSSSVVTNAGIAGETGSMKIYSGNDLKRSSDKIVGQNELLIFDPLSYNFQ